VTHVGSTASPGHPVVYCLDFIVVALDGRAGRVDTPPSPPSISWCVDAWPTAGDTASSVAAVALMFILPTSLAIGGWIGIVATLVGVTTTARLLVESYGAGGAGSDPR
jgi:hypothetical protein